MQADAGAGDAGRVAAAKVTFEKPRAVAGRNADAMVAHVHHQPARFFPRHDFGRASGGRILDGVGDQIAEGMEQKFRIAEDGRRQAGEVLDDDGAPVGIAMRLACVAQQRAGIEIAGVESSPAVEHARGAEQAVHDVGDTLHGAADSGASLRRIRRIETVLHLDEPLRVAVDDGERSSKLMGSHRYEIALLRRQPAFVLQTRLQCRRLFEQSPLARGKGDGVIPEHRHGARHLAYFIAALGARNRDFGVVIGEAPHAGGEPHQGSEDTPRDVGNDPHEQERGQQHGGHDHGTRMRVSRVGALAVAARLDDRLIGQTRQYVAG
jgi:hypothetical protein